MKEKCKNISSVLKLVFGYGIMISLFVGGLIFFGYVVALCIGGHAAEAVCVFIYKSIVPVMIYLSTIMILLGLVGMYLAGELALTPDKKQAAATESEK